MAATSEILRAVLLQPKHSLLAKVGLAPGKETGMHYFSPLAKLWETPTPPPPHSKLYPDKEWSVSSLLSSFQQGQAMSGGFVLRAFLIVFVFLKFAGKFSSFLESHI